MKKYFSPKFNKYVYELFAGDYYATREKKVIITTLLGSCVSACLMDRKTGVVGMNHFLLPGDFRREEMVTSPNAKYGMHAMEMLINAMMKLGASRGNLEAKIFGGGHVLDSDLHTVPENNIMFIRAYLSMENIPVIAEDLGGKTGRKLLYFTDTTDVYLKRVSTTKVSGQDRRFLDKVKKRGDKHGEVTLFD